MPLPTTGAISIGNIRDELILHNEANPLVNTISLLTLGSSLPEGSPGDPNDPIGNKEIPYRFSEFYGYKREFGWKGVEATIVCQIDEDEINTGFKIYTQRIKYYLDTFETYGDPVDNFPSDDNYVAPAEDEDRCPIDPDERAKGWKTDDEYAVCVLDGDSHQTGYKGWSNLVQYYIDDNTITGLTKPNVDSDPDYFPPVLDIINCPPYNPGIGTRLINIYFSEDLSSSITIRLYRDAEFAYSYTDPGTYSITAASVGDPFLYKIEIYCYSLVTYAQIVSENVNEMQDFDFNGTYYYVEFTGVNTLLRDINLYIY